MSNDALFEGMSKLLNAYPVDEVIPVLITAAARSLILDANGDLDVLRAQLPRFCRILHDQVLDMMEEDLDEAREATKQ